MKEAMNIRNNVLEEMVNFLEMEVKVKEEAIKMANEQIEELEIEIKEWEQRGWKFDSLKRSLGYWQGIKETSLMDKDRLKDKMFLIKKDIGRNKYKPTVEWFEDYIEEYAN